jgi:hypothetical protein
MLVKVFGRRPSLAEREGPGASVRKPPKHEPAGAQAQRYGDLRILVGQFRRCGDCDPRERYEWHVTSNGNAIWLSSPRSMDW